MAWMPIETIPQTLDKFLVARRYTKSIDYVEGVHAFKELASNGQKFYSFWLDAPQRPSVEEV